MTSGTLAASGSSLKPQVGQTSWSASGAIQRTCKASWQ